MLEQRTGIVRSAGRGLAPVDGDSVAIPSAQPTGGNRPNFLQVIWERRWIVLAVTIISLACGFVYLQRATPIYESSSRIYVEKSGPRILNENQSFAASGSYLYTQSELIRSTTVLNTALQSPSLRSVGAHSNVSSPVAYLKAGLNASVGKNDEIITVSFQSPSADEAAKVVNEVVSAYVTYQSKQKRSTAAEVLGILQKEKTKRDAELKGFLEQILAFKQANEALAFQSSEGNIITQRLDALSNALTATQLQLIEARAEYEAVNSVKNDPQKIRQLMPAELLDSMDQSSGQVFSRVEALEVQLGELTSRGLGEDHPSVSSLQAQIAQLQAKADARYAANQERFANLYLTRLNQEVNKLAYREQEQLKEFSAQKVQASGLNVKSAELAVLESEVQRTERLCDILDSRIKELNVTEDVGALNISILEVAQPEKNAVSPQKARVMLMALVLGLMLGAGGAMLQDLMDQRLRSAEDIQASLGIPVLGIVPHMSDDHSVPERGKKVHLEPMSDIAEAYRTVRTAIYFGVPDGEAKRMLITSPAPGDGKSTSASNTAIAMAMAGQRALIIDADFRRPTQHKIFGLKDEIGLSSVIAGRAELGQAVQKTDVKGLDVLPCGPIPPNPSELLNSQRFADLLDKLSEKYDQIVIDSPPVMAVADARILGASCDITVLVLRAGKSTRKASEHALDSLLGVGASVLGAVVNDVPRGRDRYGYYASYGYYGYYGYGSAKGSRRLGRSANEGAEHEMTVARK